MVCMGCAPWSAGWKAQTNPLSYGGNPRLLFFGLLESSEPSSNWDLLSWMLNSDHRRLETCF